MNHWFIVVKKLVNRFHFNKIPAPYCTICWTWEYYAIGVINATFDVILASLMTSIPRINQHAFVNMRVAHYEQNKYRHTQVKQTYSLSSSPVFLSKSFTVLSAQLTNKHCPSEVKETEVRGSKIFRNRRKNWRSSSSHFCIRIRMRTKKLISIRLRETTSSAYKLELKLKQLVMLMIIQIKLWNYIAK